MLPSSRLGNKLVEVKHEVGQSVSTLILLPGYMADIPFGKLPQEVFCPVVKGKEVIAGHFKRTFYLLNAQI